MWRKAWDDQWVVGVKLGTQNCPSNRAKGQQSEESYRVNQREVGKEDYYSLWAVGTRGLQKTKAHGGCRERDTTLPKALGWIPQIGGHSLVADLS